MKIYLTAFFVVFFIIIIVMAYCLLIPLMSFAGNDVYNDIKIKTDLITHVDHVDIDSIVISETDYPTADPLQWLEGSTNKVNSVLLKRLAALAQKYNKKIYISSGYRTIEEQQQIWNQRKKDHPGEPDSETRKWVGLPGGSRHNYGLAVDCFDWSQGLANGNLKEFGLIKPLSNESWHIEPIESRSGNGGISNMSVAEVLPQELQWVEVDKEKLRNFLNSKNSILADEKYLGPLIDVAKRKNVNVILLVAITGQEQSFVPRNKGNPEKVANNPFNVYHSWMEYNTNIEDSASIACNTIINLSKGRPEAIHPIQWINRKYAEDKKWWIGVSNFFVKIKNYVL